MRKVYLDNLPRFKNGKNKDRINWKESIRYIVKFEFDKIIGELEILNYCKDNKLNILYNNNVFKIAIDSLKKCGLSRVLGYVNLSYLYNIDDIVENIHNGKLKIIEQIRIGNKQNKGYKYKCLICDYDGEITEYSLNNHCGCPVCANNKIKIGFNDLWTIYPEIAKLFANLEDSYRFSYGSNLKANFKCPDCGEIIKNKIIATVIKKRLVCPKCSDHISYPEKFMYNLLFQLDISFETQQKFKWSQNKVYDFYIKNKNTIIEVHGDQHYSNNHNFKKSKSDSLRKEQENDKLKETLAKNNGIDMYVVIDTRYSELEWIKNNILNSKLSELFDLSNIGWNKCHEYSCKSLIKTVCELWNSGIKNTLHISQKLNIRRATIIQYLKQGAKINLCDYSVKEETLKSRFLARSIVQLNKISKEFISEHPSISEARRQVKKGDISACLKGEQKTAGGYIWMYSEIYYKEKII